MSDQLRRGNRPQQPPLLEEAHALADMLFNDAMELVDILAPDNPIDTVQLEDREIYRLLESIAVELPVMYWDDHPEAIRDLARLRKAFGGRDSEYLIALATRFESINKKKPDHEIAPGGPAWEAQEKRMSS